MADRNSSQKAGKTDNTDDQPYAGVGNRLHMLRTQKGISLEEVSEKLKINVTFIDALECGQLQDMPGLAYVLGFARTYSNFLGADTKSIVEDLKAEAAGTSDAAKLSFPEPVGEASMARGPVLLAAVILVAIVWGVWYFYISAPPEGRGIDLMPDRLMELLSEAEAPQSDALDPPDVRG